MKVSRRIHAALAVLALVGGTLPARAAAQPAAQATRDLKADERAGGHTLARHVGKTDQELLERLSRENISAASTYTDATTAAVIVAAALDQSAVKLKAWLNRRGSRPNLVINYLQPKGPPIGRSIRRGQKRAVSCYRALVVVRWDDRRSAWYVLTSYPEA